MLGRDARRTAAGVSVVSGIIVSGTVVPGSVPDLPAP
jgi:hypothetical protein